MFYLLNAKTEKAPQPVASVPMPVASAGEPTPFDPMPVVKAHTGKAISNGAKAELLASWDAKSAPEWVPESSSRVKLMLKHGQQSLELAWRIENGQAVPDNKLAQELEAWTPGKDSQAPAFLASTEPVVEETVTPVADLPASTPTPRTQSAPQEPSQEWRDDGDPSTITNADLPKAAFAPKKPKTDKTEPKTAGTKPEQSSAGNLRLMGVMDGDGGKKAIINQGGQYVEVREGESVGNYRVQSINGKEVVLDKNGTRVRVSSDSGNGPPPKPEKPQPPPRPEMPTAPSMTIDQDLEVPPIEEPVFDPGPFEDGK